MLYLTSIKKPLKDTSLAGTADFHWEAVVPYSNDYTFKWFFIFLCKLCSYTHKFGWQRLCPFKHGSTCTCATAEGWRYSMNKWTTVNIGERIITKAIGIEAKIGTGETPPFGIINNSKIVEDIRSAVHLLHDEVFLPKYDHLDMYNEAACYYGALEMTQLLRGGNIPDELFEKP